MQIYTKRIPGDAERLIERRNRTILPATETGGEIKISDLAQAKPYPAQTRKTEEPR
jgi:hypothetical protein